MTTKASAGRSKQRAMTEPRDSRNAGSRTAPPYPEARGIARGDSQQLNNNNNNNNKNDAQSSAASPTTALFNEFKTGASSRVREEVRNVVQSSSLLVARIEDYEKLSSSEAARNGGSKSIDESSTSISPPSSS